MRFAIELQPYLDNRSACEAFIRSKKREMAETTGSSCFNVYAASVDWDYIPDYDKPEDYDVPRRSWYIGAVRKQGRPFVTDPYVDAMTGSICFTFLCCSDERLIGKSLMQELPDYAGIFSLAKSSVQTVNIHQRGENLFAALLTVLIISMSINITASLQYGKGEMQRVVSDYERQLTEWIKTQKSILDMFCSMISTDADRLNRYDDMVAYLDGITKQYPDGDGIA